MPPVGFEPTISPSERPQTYALDREATGTRVPNSSMHNCHGDGGRAGDGGESRYSLFSFAHTYRINHQN